VRIIYGFLPTPLVCHSTFNIGVGISVSVIISGVSFARVWLLFVRTSD